VLLPAPAGVRFSGVSFAYPSAGFAGADGLAGSDGSGSGSGSGSCLGSGRKILEGFSYDFVPGSRTAIAGPTGVGKSTMIRLMLALLSPQKGSVQVYSRGVVSGDAYQASPATRCNLVYVPQGNTLFSGTVRENLLMGNPQATDEQLRSVLHTAAADFVFDLPLGLDTQCFESGAGLSEGQAQRIAIARALLRPGSILLLDEFSSALDAETESTLLERLTSELPDHTMIFITHRDRIIDFCDSVLRLG
jgi:ABC-type multidrug transport system fused ATPase/permease subunit